MFRTFALFMRFYGTEVYKFLKFDVITEQRIDEICVEIVGRAGEWHVNMDIIFLLDKNVV